MNPQNLLGQPVGSSLDNWSGALPLKPLVLSGKYCSLEPINPQDHVDDLWEAFQKDTEGRVWTYLSYGPFQTKQDFEAQLASFAQSEDPLYFAIRRRDSRRVAGWASHLRIDPEMGTVEVGHINFSPSLQRTREATETIYLLMSHAFELGYRRYEWKCDALNQPSRKAAARLGFRYEGTFRQAVVYKGRSRDTAWFSITDKEWPHQRQRFEAWLSSSNFDDQGQQRRPLGAVPEETEASDQPPMGIIFDAAKIEDLEAIVALLHDDVLGALREQEGSELGPEYREAFAAIDADPKNELLVARKGKEVVGVLQLTWIPGLSHRGGTRVQIESVRIARHQRSHGLGKTMIQWVISRARQRNAVMVQLTSDKSRSDAIRFYESIGFKPSHEGLKFSL